MSASFYLSPNRTAATHWRSQDFVLRLAWEPRRRIGAEFETPKASSGERNGEGVSRSPADWGGLGERRKLPQRGLAEPRPKTDFDAFWAWKNESGDDKFDIFCHFYRAYLELNLQG